MTTHTGISGKTYFADDWLLFDTATPDEHSHYTVHELCSRYDCTHSDFATCPFHPQGCQCSLGACQYRDGIVTERARKPRQKLDSLDMIARLKTKYAR